MNYIIMIRLSIKLCVKKIIKTIIFAYCIIILCYIIVKTYLFCYYVNFNFIPLCLYIIIYSMFLMV